MADKFGKSASRGGQLRCMLKAIFGITLPVCQMDGCPGGVAAFRADWLRGFRGRADKVDSELRASRRLRLSRPGLGFDRGYARPADLLLHAAGHFDAAGCLHHSFALRLVRESGNAARHAPLCRTGAHAALSLHRRSATDQAQSRPAAGRVHAALRCSTRSERADITRGVSPARSSAQGWRTSDPH